MLRTASPIRPEDVEWYFEGRVASRESHSAGRSRRAGEDHVRVRVSGAWQHRGQLGSPAAAVIFATAEDSLAHTLVPRLTAAGADLDRVHFVSIRGDDGTRDWAYAPGGHQRATRRCEEDGCEPHRS